MESVHNKFLTELKNLRALIQHYDLEHTLLKIDITTITDADSKTIIEKITNSFRSISTDKRQFNYNSLIISLYGSFERFIQDLIITYAERLNNLFREYNDIPEKIRQYHYNLSLALLKKVENPRYTGSIRIEEVIKNIHGCLANNIDFTLNTEAFSQHSSNYRLPIICESFQRIGIEKLSHILIQNKFLKEYLDLRYEENDRKLLNESDFFSFIEDLAERRNEVAHGVPNEILSNNILLDFITFFEHFSNAITDILVDQYFRIECEQKGMLIGSPLDIYKNGAIVILRNNFVEVKKGDTIIGMNNASIIKGKILSLQFYGLDTNLIGNTVDEEIGILTDKAFNKNHTFYLLKT